MTTHCKYPFRQVAEARLNDNESGRFWILHLECGHEDTRPVAYVSRGKMARGGARKNGPMRPIEDLKAAPERIRCDQCR